MIPAPSVMHVHQFLESRGWARSDSGVSFLRFTPPDSLGLPTGFDLTLPRDASAPDAPRFVERLIGTIADIYGITPQQVEPVLASADTVFSLKIDDKSTAGGSIRFPQFEAMIDKLRKVLLDSAAFVLSEDPVLDRVPPQASLYLADCKFLQTSRGSFIANVQLPSRTVMREATFEDPEPIRAAAVTDRIVGVLNVVVGSVLAKRPEAFSEEFVTQHLDVLNVNVLQDISALFDRAANASLKLSFVGVEATRVLSSGPLTADRREALSKYVEFVREQVSGTLPVEVVGPIVELRSRNPQSNRNYVVIAGSFEGRPTFVAMTLNNELYAQAIQAHRNSRRVHVTGIGRRMKTQVKLTRLDIFEPQ